MWKLGFTKDGRLVGLDKAARRVHVHAIGGSGSGKSTCLDKIIRQIIAWAEAGLMLLDPHGTLYDAILSFLALHGVDLKRRIHLIEPGIADRSPGFNPLALPRECLAPGVSAIVDAIAQVWGGEDTDAKPRLKRMLRATLYLLAEHGLTLIEAKAVLSLEHKVRRNALAGLLTNTYFRQEWASLAGIPDKEWVTFVESVENRLGPFLSSPIVRRMIGRREQVFDLAGAMDRGDIVLVNLALTDQFTEEDQRLVGTLLLNELRRCALQRRRATPPFYAVIDECYKFLSADVESMLVETRKRGVHLLLAHQNLAQLGTPDSAIYQAVMAIPNKIVFGSVTADNARTLADEIFCGEFDLETLKTKHTAPVVVGHKLVWLKSQARSRTSGTSETDGGGETRAEGRSEPEIAPESGGGVRIGTTTTTAHNTQRTTAESANESSGRSQAFRPILEERATQLYSLEELKHQAAARIKGQVTGIAIVKALGMPTEQVEITMPKPGLPRSGERFVAWKRHLMDSSPHILPADAVERLIEARSQEHGLGGQTPSREDESEPNYERRMVRKRGAS
jgi:hypothetical protein